MPSESQLGEIETSLHKKIRAATEKSQASLSADEVSEIVREVIVSLTGDVTAADLKFYAELEELASYIHHAKQEIASIRPKEISSDHIPNATDELDAVVGATEEATNKIMDECDVISGLAGEAGEEVGEKLVACTTRIFEACNFQDITGQRITKVVQTLKHIDEKIAALIQALGEELGQETFEEEATKEKTDEDLLNGPQLAHAAIDQDEIDRLMSE